LSRIVLEEGVLPLSRRAWSGSTEERTHTPRAEIRQQQGKRVYRRQFTRAREPLTRVRVAGK